jgi:hypothetical protein
MALATSLTTVVVVQGTREVMRAGMTWLLTTMTRGRDQGWMRRVRGRTGGTLTLATRSRGSSRSSSSSTDLALQQ